LFWLDGFKTIRTWILEQSLPIFNYLINKYLQKMKTDFYVNLAHSSNKLVMNVMSLDKKTRNIRTFSRGEMCRIGMAFSFALRDFHIGKNKHFSLVLDEVLDSLDSSGVEELLFLLDSLDEQVFLITHNNSIDIDWPAIEVFKVNNISHVRHKEII